MGKKLTPPQHAERSCYTTFEIWQDRQDWEDIALWDIEEIASFGWINGFQAGLAYAAGVQEVGEQVSKFMSGEPIEQEKEENDVPTTD